MSYQKMSKGKQSHCYQRQARLSSNWPHQNMAPPSPAQTSQSIANKHMALNPNHSMGVFKSRKMQTPDGIPEKHKWLICTQVQIHT